MNKRPRLLLVDDDALNCEVALEHLREIGLGADLAANGEIAVAMADATPYDLILMDIQMPVLDGYQATRRILALTSHQLTPIVALTANTLPETRDTCMAAGMVDYLSKPVATDELRLCLERWLPGFRPSGKPVAAGSPAHSLLATLRVTDGFAPAIALETLGIKPEKYPVLLRKYVEVHHETVAKAGAARRAGDLELARRLVHTLKGTAATLGLVATRESASHLDKALHDMLGEAVDNARLDALFGALADTDRRQQTTLRRLLAAQSG